MEKLQLEFKNEVKEDEKKGEEVFITEAAITGER
jgi:hypothetical protein